MTTIEGSQFQTIHGKEHAHQDGIWSVVWTTNNKIISGSVDETVKVWDTALNSDQGKSFEGHRLGVVSVAVNTEGTWCACSSIDSVIRFWDLETGETSASIDEGALEAWSLALSPHDKFLATGAQRGAVNIWDAEAKKKMASLTHGSRGSFVMSVAFSPLVDQLQVAGSSKDGSIAVYDVQAETLDHRFSDNDAHSMPVRSVAYSPDGRLLYSASDDMRIHLYDVRCKSLVCSLSGHASWALSVAPSPNGYGLASGSSDNQVKIWDMRSRECLHCFADHKDQVWSVAYSPDGASLAAGVDDGSLHVHQVA